MSCISEFRFNPLKTFFKKRSAPAIQKLDESFLKSEDTLVIEKRAEELAELNKMEPPKMSQWERFIAKLRGTNDTIPYPGGVKLLNFDKVDDLVYRGAMPTSGPEFEKLKKVYNVHTIIDLRGPRTTTEKDIEFEQKWSKFHGLQYEHFDMDSKKEPTEKQLTRLFQIMADAEAAGGTVYIHCKNGIDRTGSMMVAYELMKAAKAADANLLKYTESGHLDIKATKALQKAYQKELKRVQKESYRKMQKRGFNLFHKITRSAQRRFATDKNLLQKVQSAESERIKKKKSRVG